MAISVANSNNWKHAASTSNQFANNVSTGNLMVAVSGTSTGTIATVSDSDGGWDQVGVLGSPGDGFGRVSIWYKRVVSGQNGTMPTVATSSGAGTQRLSIIELTGNHAVDIVEGSDLDRGTGPGDTTLANMTMTIDGGYTVAVYGAINPGFSSSNTTMIAESALDATTMAFGADFQTDPPGTVFTSLGYTEAEDWWGVCVLFKAAEEGEEPPEEPSEICTCPPFYGVGKFMAR